MLINRNNPKGVDYYLGQAQKELYYGLLKLWGGVYYDCYGRIYKNTSSAGYIPQVYTGDGEYKEVLWDDSLDALSFFLVAEQSTKPNANHVVDVGLVFFVNLEKIKPAMLERGDEDVRSDVYGVLGKNAFGLTYKSTITGLRSVLEDFSGGYKVNADYLKKMLLKVDMQPYHCFRINYSLQFNPHKQSKTFIK